MTKPTADRMQAFWSGVGVLRMPVTEAQPIYERASRSMELEKTKEFCFGKTERCQCARQLRFGR